MKKNRFILFIVMAIAVQISFTSCQKEGVFRPDKKISAIYESTEYTYEGDDLGSTPKTLTERWIWGKKDLEKIVLYSGNTESGTLNFSYDKGQLTEMTSSSSSFSSSAKLHYKNSKLTRIETFLGSIPVSVVEILERNNGKITKMSISLGSMYLKTTSNEVDILKRQMSIISRFFFTDKIGDQFSKMITENSKSENLGEPVEINLTYSGDNVTVSKIVTSETHFQHDNKNNPFYNALGGTEGAGYNSSMFSKNNITKITIRYLPENNIEEENFEYKYDGDWPIEKIQTILLSPLDASIITKTHYEYK